MKSQHHTNPSVYVRILLPTLLLWTGLSATASAQEIVIEAVDVNSTEAQEARSQKTEQWLEVARTQLQRRQYGPALETLSTCRLANGSMTDAHRQQLEALFQEADAGLKAQEQGEVLLGQIDQALAANDMAQAQTLLGQVEELNPYLSEPMNDKVTGYQNTIKVRQMSLKDQMKSLFKESVTNYKAGKLQEAQDGFVKIRQSGVKLTFWDTGDFTDSDGYLQKIAEKMGQKQAEMMAAKPADKPQDWQQPETVMVTEPAETVVTAEPERAATTTATQQPVSKPAPAAEKEQGGGFRLFGKKKTELTPGQQEQINLWLAEGELAMVNGNHALAREYFQKVVALDPNVTRAQQGLAAADFSLAHPQTAQQQEKTILDKMRDRQQAQREYVQARFADSSQKVSRLLGEQNFTQARAEASQTLAVLDGARSLLEPAQYQQMREETRGLLNQVDAAETKYNEEMLTKTITDAQQQEMQRQRQAQVARQMKIEELWQRALKFKEARQYELAASTLDQMLALDEQNVSAKILMEHMEDMMLVEKQAKYMKSASEHEARLFVETHEAGTPYSEITTFPANWPELTERRLQLGKKKEYYGTDKQRAALEKMDTTIIDVNFIEREFRAAMEELRSYGLNIAISWNDLELAGVYDNDYVNLQLEGVSVGKALDRILAYVSGGKLDRLGFKVDDEGIIEVNTVTMLGPDYNYSTRVYYVADLIEHPSYGSDYGGGGGGGGGSYGSGGSSRSSGGSSSRSGGSSSRGGGGSYSRMTLPNQPAPQGDSGVTYVADENNRGNENSDNYDFAQYGGGRSGGSSRSGGGSSSRGGGSYGGGRSGGGGGGYGGGSANEDYAYRLIDLITMTVSPESWAYGSGSMGGGRQSGMYGGGGAYGAMSAGGLTGMAQIGYGQVDVYGVDSLIIYQTEKVHNEIEILLKKIRSTRGDQVSIESRLLVINSNFLEQIGLDIDFYFNLDNAGFDRTGSTDTVTGRQILNPRTQGGNRWTPLVSTNDSMSGAGPSATAIPGSLGGGAIPSAFNMGASFLDNIQVDFLISATQAHTRSKTLVAPHVTVFNGEGAYIEFGTESSYVAEAEAVLGYGIGLFDPEIEQDFSGIFLIVEPTISADKRYVHLNVEVSQETTREIQEFTTQTGSTGTTETDEPIAGVPTLIIQQPIKDINSVVTHVAVPDGGTLLLGGQKLTGEIEREVGVPGLSTIPLVNRLFTNRSVVRDDSVLLILIKPRIILREEEEELHFGNLNYSEELQQTGTR